VRVVTTLSARFASGLHLALERIAMPYGYTLTIWSSGAMLLHRHGLPSPGDVFLFIGGSGAAVLTLTVVARRRRLVPMPADTSRLQLTGALQVLSIVAAVGVAGLAASMPGAAAWAAASFTATGTFVLATAFVAGCMSVAVEPPDDGLVAGPRCGDARRDPYWQTG
jgi:hypothetical protein